MNMQELFSHEFDAFYFKEIHRNPPASLLSSAKPEIKDRTGLFGYIAGTTIFGHDALKFPGKDDIEKELEQELKKRESNFYDYLIAYMDKKGIGDETELYKKAEVNRATYSKIKKAACRKTDCFFINCGAETIYSLRKILFRCLSPTCQTSP